MNHTLPTSTLQIYFWILFLGASVFFMVALFFVKKWIGVIEKNQKSFTLELQEHKKEVDNEINKIKLDVAQINKENSILDSKIEKFALESKSYYEQIKLHLEYQKESINYLTTCRILSYYFSQIY